MLLGYTRAGHEVRLPTERSFSAGDFVGWTSGDHVDASRILREHSEREQDREVRSWCKRWAKAHRALRSRTPKIISVRGAELSIKVRGPR